MPELFYAYIIDKVHLGCNSIPENINTTHFLF